MNPREAIEVVRGRFPFGGYIGPGVQTAGGHLNIANTVLRFLPPGSRILDFGCGPCDKTAVLQLLGYRCSGCDDLRDHWHLLPGNREKIAAFAQESSIDLHADLSAFTQGYFDMVMLHDVLEHLHDSPRDLLNDLLALTRPEGLLFVTVPNAANIRKRVGLAVGKTNLPAFDGYYWYPGAWRGHIREYVRNDLMSLSDYLGLRVLDLRGCDHMLHKVPAVVRPLYLAITLLLMGWKDSWLLVARKPPSWTPRTLPDSELAEVLGSATTYRYGG